MKIKQSGLLIASILAAIFLVSIFVEVIFTPSKAESKTPITIINSGKAGGSFNARTQMYMEGLIAAGYDVTYENIGKISQAVKIFKDTDKPTIMVYANNQVYKQDLFHTEQNFILLEYQQPLYICRTNKWQFKIGKLTVAHGKGYDPKLLTDLLGDDVVLVPYKNSGAMLKGILGGDVDMMINNQGKSFKYMASGQGTCEPSNKLPIMQATVIGTNLDVQLIREILYDITMSVPFIDYHLSRKLFRPSSTWSHELAIVQSLEKEWKN